MQLYPEQYFHSRPSIKRFAGNLTYIIAANCPSLGRSVPFFRPNPPVPFAASAVPLFYLMCTTLYKMYHFTTKGVMLHQTFYSAFILLLYFEKAI